MHIIESTGLHTLLEGLVSRGYALIGPTVRSGAIVYDAIRSVDDLPRGYGDEQEPSHYTLKKREDDMIFGFAVGPVSWKKFLYPPQVTTFRATRAGKGFTITPGGGEARPKMAFIGVRPCELSAIAIQDKVFTGGEYIDRAYKAARDSAFIVTVNCTVTSGNCFCASMGTGPGAAGGYDIALTEVLEGPRHYFVAASGSPRGEEVLGGLTLKDASGAETKAGADAVARAAASQTKRMNTQDLPRMLKDNFEHPRWDDVAKRCLACTNCTMVCPTCFCSTVEDATDLSGMHAERKRKWDSCFTMDFTKVAGGNVRPSTRARYRQWMTHKLSNWMD
ncbi:MAG TPA: 4Fe-4S dicluster domain-containing protein, partial [Bacteroidota bacterium]|nr:4Fe-4S dicluster domain-containing protein [Bacteroidota bacterium]